MHRVHKITHYKQ